MLNFLLKVFSSLCLIFSSTLFAGEVIKSHVEFNDGLYVANLEIQIEAPTKKVYALFTDFDYLTQLSDNITNSELVSGEYPEYIVEIKTHNCVLFFCKDIKQTQHVIEQGEGYISVEDIEGKGDFVSAITLWHIRAVDSGTRVTFHAEMKPDFWLPPLLGPWLFKKRLIKDTQAMIERLEELATDDNEPPSL